jgi:hypothetical protein
MWRRYCQASLFALMLAGPMTVIAQGFSALVSPPRFEDAAQPATTYRDIVEISNIADTAAHFNLRTADWTLDAQGAAVFDDALAPDSCRPWVGLEAREITIAARGKRRYRFEVVVPPDAPSGECRFAILIEGDPESIGAMAMPVSGRIGVIVYLTIGKAVPQLDVIGTGIARVDERMVPVLQIRNTGTAHGRLAGWIDGTDASGRKLVFAPTNLPILPGERQAIALHPEGDAPDTPAPTINFPVHLKGQLEVGAQRLSIDTVVAQ